MVKCRFGSALVGRMSSFTTLSWVTYSYISTGCCEQSPKKAPPVDHGAPAVGHWEAEKVTCLLGSIQGPMHNSVAIIKIWCKQAGSDCKASCSGRWWQWDSVGNVYQAHIKNSIPIWITQCIWTPLKARIFSSLVSQYLDRHFQHDYSMEYQEHYRKLFLLLCPMPRYQPYHTLNCQIIRYTYLTAWCISFGLWNSMNLPWAFGWLHIALSLGWNGKSYIWSEPS